MSKHAPPTPPGSSSAIRLSEAAPRPSAALSIAELEEGLAMLDRGEASPEDFWKDNLAAFRQTLLVAIRDTSDALLSPRLSPDLRRELELQLPALNCYLLLADRQRESRHVQAALGPAGKFSSSIN